MGEYRESVNWHYSKGNISALINIMNDTTIDTDDRELAHEFIEELKKRNKENERKDREEIEDREEK